MASISDPLGRLIRVTALLAAIGHASAAPNSGQEPYDYRANCRAWPAVSGPHGVGTLELELTDSLRSAQYAPTPPDPGPRAAGPRRALRRSRLRDTVAQVAPRPAPILQHEA